MFSLNGIIVIVLLWSKFKKTLKPPEVERWDGVSCTCLREQWGMQQATRVVIGWRSWESLCSRSFPMAGDTDSLTCWRALLGRRKTRNSFNIWTGYWVIENVKWRVTSVWDGRFRKLGKNQDEGWRSHLFCFGHVCENETERGICVGSVAVHSPPEPAEPVQSSDRLLAGRLTRESSNSWMMARKGGGAQRESERENRGRAG